MDKIKKRRFVRTDLAVENFESLMSKEKEEPDGISSEVEKSGDIVVTSVKIHNKNGEYLTGKLIGNYITVECERLKENDEELKKETVIKVSEKLKELAEEINPKTVLVAGLGNRYITPDSLGPRVVESINVTRHLNENLKGYDDKISVAAVSPGVMGVTGIETGEILKGIVEKIKPDLLIAVDALAARKVSRINTTIQMADSGISPGAGVGNRRMILNRESLGIPVIGIGVPTVVDALTLVNDTINAIISETENLNFGMDEDEMYSLINESECMENMFVTPKEIDEDISIMAEVISRAINISLKTSINGQDNV